MSVCAHDAGCSGFGWMHDAQLTLDQKLELGLPIEGEISMAHAKRLMRSYRKGFAAGIQWAENAAKNAAIVEAQEAEVNADE